MALGLVAVGAPSLVACEGGQPTWFTRIAEARRLAADLRVQFGRAADASNRSVMAETDEDSIAFAAEAEEAKKALGRDSEALLPLLRHSTEIGLLQEFARSFAEYEALDRAILALAVENSNLKAQRLSFGPERESADAFRSALDSFALSCGAGTRCRALPLVYSAVVAVRDILTLEAPHIAETADQAMTKLEADMDGLLASARAALQDLSSLAPAPSREPLGVATAALARFEDTRAKIILLSRANTNVRSLAMSLGPKRAIITACDSKLTALQDALEQEGIKATR